MGALTLENKNLREVMEMENEETVSELREEIEKPDIQTSTDTTLPDSYAGGLRLVELDGNSEQKTFTGKNTFNINETVEENYFTTIMNGLKVSNPDSIFSSIVDFTVNNNSIVINSYKTDGFPWLSKWITLNKNTMYTISGIIGSAVKVCGINSKELGSTAVELGVCQSGNTSFTFNSGDYDYYYITMYPHSAGTEYSNLQIEEGTEATSYEPYVGGITSPNPEYPQEINIPFYIKIKLYDKITISTDIYGAISHGVFILYGYIDYFIHRVSLHCGF